MKLTNLFLTRKKNGEINHQQSISISPAKYSHKLTQRFLVRGRADCCCESVDE